MKLHPCRNCGERKSCQRPDGLCFKCWHWLEYGKPLDLEDVPTIPFDPYTQTDMFDD